MESPSLLLTLPYFINPEENAIKAIHMTYHSVTVRSKSLEIVVQKLDTIQLPTYGMPTRAKNNKSLETSRNGRKYNFENSME